MVIFLASDKRKASSELYSAKMIYTKKNVKAISEIKYNEYNLLARILQIAAAIILVPIALITIKNQLPKYVVLGVAIFLLLTNNATPRANSVNFEKVNGGYPSILYLFYENQVSSNGVKCLFTYDQLTRLVEDDSYLYLFENQLTVFVLDKSTISGDGGLDGLKCFLEDKTDLKFKKPAGIINSKK